MTHPNGPEPTTPVTDTSTVAVLVPSPDSPELEHVDSASAIVGRRLGNGKWLVYYESNRYEAHNLTRFADKAYQAFSRMDAAYPTVAFGVVSASAVIVVGWLNTVQGVVTITDHDTFDQWAPAVPADDLMTSSSRHEIARAGFPVDLRPSQLARFVARHPTHPAVRRWLGR